MGTSIRLDPPPLVSIIIPALDEERFVERTLEALRRQRYPRDRYEVILVDNGSSDGTVEAARRAGARVVVDTDARIGGLRNRGVAVAAGEVLAFIDADCVAPEGWIQEAVAALAEPGVAAVGGPCVAPADGSWVEIAWAPGRRDGPRDVAALATSSFVVEKSTFERVGGFDPTLEAGEDDDLSRRLRAGGDSLRSLPGCQVTHLDYPATLRGVARRQVRHGRSLALATGEWTAMAVAGHAFALSLVAALVSAFLPGLAPAGVAVSGLAGVALAAVLAVNRRPRGAVHALQLTAIYWFFLLGQAAGTSLAYLDRVRGVGRRLRRSLKRA